MLIIENLYNEKLQLKGLFNSSILRGNYKSEKIGTLIIRSLSFYKI